jgi:formylglycine-generating enzyme required for sulfatase activity
MLRRLVILLAATVLFAPVACGGSPKISTSSIGMEFVLVPAGSFLMGTDASRCKDDPFTERNEYSDCAGSDDERPAHRVTISKAFYLGKYEVTQEEWVKVMGTNPSDYKSEKVGGDSRRHPVESVSWDDLQAFLGRLNAKEGGSSYRLPTEAEWEYASRAGSTASYAFGDDDSRLGEYAWFAGNSGEMTHPVGQLKPNAWGLYDMHGNVWEWVRDWFDAAYYGKSPSADPGGPPAGAGRGFRGGGWRLVASYCRSAVRSRSVPGIRNSDLGARLVRTLEP